MSQITSAWVELYSAQTDALGAITATVGAVATNKRCIPSEAPVTPEFAPGGGGIAEPGERTVQMLASDFSAAPAQFVNVVVSDDARTMKLLDYTDNGGVRYLRIGDPAAEN